MNFSLTPNEMWMIGVLLCGCAVMVGHLLYFRHLERKDAADAPEE